MDSVAQLDESSLSKVFRVIHRFSENIDPSVHRDDLRFHGDRAGSARSRPRILDRRQPFDQHDGADVLVDVGPVDP
jgi:hypothetical protein